MLAGPVPDQNVWRARQQRSGTFVVWDHTGRATVEPYRPKQPMVLCRYVSASWGGAGAFQTGQNPTSAYLYPSAEITPATAAAPPRTGARTLSSGRRSGSRARCPKWSPWATSTG